MLIYGLLFFIGHQLGHQLCHLFEFTQVQVRLLGLIITLFLLLMTYFRIRKHLLICLIYFSLGCYSVIIFVNELSLDKVTNSMLGETHWVEGEVIEVISNDAKYLRFIVDVSNFSAGNWKHNMMFTWYFPPDNLRELVKEGSIWRLPVRVKPPQGLRNPGGVDREQLYFHQKIRAVGYIDNKYQADHLGYRSSLLFEIRDNISQLLSSHEASDVFPLVEALTLGVKDNFTDEHWNVLRKTGTSHLMAISGLHVGMVAVFVYIAVSFFYRYLTSWSLIWPAQSLAAVLAFLVICFYCMVAGFGLPTQRALIMTGLFLLAKSTQTSVWSIQTFVWALIFVLCWDPMASYSAGFWLSFVACFILIYGSFEFSKSNNNSNNTAVKLVNGFKKTLWVQLKITAILWPLTLLFFSESPVLGLFINMLAIPWLSFLILPFILLGVSFYNTLLGNFLLNIGIYFLEILWTLLIYITNNWAIVHEFKQPSLIIVIAGCMSLLFYLLPKALPGRWLVLLAWLPIFFPHEVVESEDIISVIQLDIGQGASTVIETKDYTIIYDVGPNWGNSYSAAEQSLIPMINKRGRKNIDLLIISHQDNDHSGGLEAVNQNLNVLNSYINDPLSDKKGRFAEMQACRAGQKIALGDLFLTFLHPEQLSGNSNRDSCVVAIQFGETQLLLTGDIDKKSELELLEYANQNDIDLRSKILLAPHHGSSTSSSIDFIQAVAPQHVLFATGWLNQWQFPRQDVVQRYRQQGAKLWHTALMGAVELSFNKDGDLIKAQCHGYRQKRYWHSDRWSDAVLSSDLSGDMILCKP